MKKSRNALVFLAIVLVIFVAFSFEKKGLVKTEIIEKPAVKETTQASRITIEPQTIYPGDPVFISVKSAPQVKSISWDDKELKIFNYLNLPRAFNAIDINEKPREHILKITFEDGEILTQNVKVTEREKIEAPLGIPEKLGGNTEKASDNLVKVLAEENYILNTVESSTTLLWDEAFVYPLENIFITDDYGYDRKTVTQTIAHKGTDFRATIGTPVMAMNDGEVKISRKFVAYGNAVVIDHGLGVQTLYMHLSQANVKVGDMVKKGDIVGLSGDTGYVEAAHLHISVKIDRISIDPMTFLKFFLK